jgi:dienelactone hydrolase
MAQAQTADEVRDGLRQLYKNANCKDEKFCLNSANESTLVANALEFKKRFEQTVHNAPIPQVTWKRVGYSVQEFEFDSLVQRAGDHASNKVRGFVYEPAAYRDCDIEFPATILVHKLGNDLDSEKQIAEYAAKSNQGLVMLIYLPHFGPRKQGSENFISSNFEAFEGNILQSLADIHQSYRALKELPKVRKDDMGLMGLSLGAMISLISAGIDPVFDRYATNVGGGDLANIVTYRERAGNDVDSETIKALKDVEWSVDQARFYMSRFDAITWSSNAKKKSVVMINADQDELIMKPLSIDPLIESYQRAGSPVQLIMHPGTHVFKAKQVGYMNTLTKVMLPMFKFIGGKTGAASQCTPRSNN